MYSVHGEDHKASRELIVKRNQLSQRDCPFTEYHTQQYLVLDEIFSIPRYTVSSSHSFQFFNDNL